MKTNYFILMCLAFFFCATSLTAQSELQKALPLLQKNNRTEAENRQVLQLFRSSKTPDVVFAAGASLVKNPPAKIQEPALFSLVLRQGDSLKQTFAAIIITAMGSAHAELLPVLENALLSQDTLLRSYAAGALALLNPQNETYADDIVRLYAYDPAFAQRALNMFSKPAVKYLKTACAHEDASVRAAAAAWLGTLHSEEASKQLLKMAKTEQDASVQTHLATALAKNRDFTQNSVFKELKRDYNSPVSATYALALGFMTGNAVEDVRQGLISDKENVRINALRAAAYMAGVLSNDDAFNYTTDRTFDIRLLKSLIPQLSLLARTGNPTVKSYAQNAMKQIEKLMD
ncbi:MAG: HEAT repeat domain-containing protein [Elusimicrobiaceae bacterium]|nr:HEAT repeat domain-containing protein [Elusimicrobiaceae bacterium]